MKWLNIVGFSMVAVVALSENAWATELMNVNTTVSRATSTDMGFSDSARPQELLSAGHKLKVGHGNHLRHINSRVNSINSGATPDERNDATFFSPYGSTASAGDTQESHNNVPTLTDPLLMFLALVGLVVLQLRRKQKTLPHRSLASWGHEIHAPVAKAAELELTLQS